MRADAGADLLDLDVHGVVGVRLVGARPADARAAKARLGASARPLGRAPDIVVRFVPRLETRGLRYVEPGRAGYDDEGYVILSHGRRPVRARIPLGVDLPPYVIQCEHGTRPIPLLDAWMRLVALARGYVPLHASAFELDGTGVLVAGGPHAGKTSSMLAFASRGARFIADDLVLLDTDSGAMLGATTELSLADSQLDQLPPDHRFRIGPLRRGLLAGASLLERFGPRTASGDLGGLLHAAGPALRRRLKVRLSPDALFAAPSAGRARADVIFLAVSHVSSDTAAERETPARLAARLAAALRLELRPVHDHYDAYRFAFPDRRSELLEGAVERAERLLRRALEDRPVFLLRHPYPPSFEALRTTMEPLIEAAGAASASPPFSGRGVS